MTAGFFSVKVRGEYFAQVGDKRELRGYEATFRLPNADKPLSIIAGKLLLPFLQKKDPQCFGYYTHFIDEISCEGRRLEPNEIPVRFQSKEQLRQYIKFHQLPISVDDYADLGKLRDHVRMAKEEPDNFPTVSAKHKEKMAAENALFALNADILIETNKPVPTRDGGKTTESATAGPAENERVVKPKPKRTTKPKPKPVVLDEAEELLS